MAAASGLVHCGNKTHDYGQEHNTENVVEYSGSQGGHSLRGIHLLPVRDNAGSYTYRCGGGHDAEEETALVPEMGVEDCHAGGCSEDEGEYYTGDTDYSPPYRIAEEKAKISLKT